MMKSIVRIPIMVLLVVCAAPSASAFARTPDPVQAAPTSGETPESRGVARTVVVAHLVEWARANRDADALLTAARMLAEVPMRTGQDGDSGLEPVLTPQGLRQEAAALGDNRSRVDDVVVTGSRVTREPPPPAEAAAPPRPPRPITSPPPPPAPVTAPVPAPSVPMLAPMPAPITGVLASPFGVGPISTIKRLNSRESWSFVVDARGAQLLRVAAIGDGDTNIDLIVRNEQGQVLCADGFDDHYPSCTLSPPAPARLRVNVVNRGDVWTKVQILSN